MADVVLYEVEALLAKKVLPSKRVVYLVRWKGFSSDYDSWEPYGNLKSCRPLITIFNKGSRAVGTPVPPKQSPSSKTGANEDTRPKTSANEDTKLKTSAKEDTRSKTSANEDIRPKTSSKEDARPKTSANEDGRSKISGSENRSDTKQVKRTKILKNITSVTKKKSHTFKTAAGKASFSTQKTKTFKFPIALKTKPLKAKKEAKSTSLVKDTEKSPEAVIVTQTGNTNAPKPGRKTSKKRKLDSDDLNKSIKKLKIKRKKSEKENIQENKKDFEGIQNTQDLSIELDDGDDDDSGILYSLNADCDIANLEDVKTKEDTKVKATKSSVKVKSNSEQSKSVILKQNSTTQAKKMIFNKDSVHKKKKMSLIDSKKPSKDWLTKTGLVHSASPSPMFTTVKHMVISPDSQDPSKPSGNSHQEPVPPEASETYLADVPSTYPVPGEEAHTSKQLLSPRSLSYNSLLDSLPDQLHPGHKGSKKSKSDSSSGDSSSGASSALVSYSVGGEQVERRTSVRSTECAFRYKQIVVKKCVRYTQIWLNTQTAMKNALNPQVIQEVVSALNSAKYDDSHLVLFSSLGNVFCSGTDLHVLVSGDRKVSARQMADAIRELTKTFITFPKPIIAAVSGAAVGLGVSLLALCDIVYASDKASFHLPYSQLSQTPEGCSSYTLPLTLGLPSANELLYGGRKITAMEAYQLGLVSQVFWPTLMMQEVIPRAQNMATCSAKALEATKLLVRSHHRTKMELTNETECNLLLERWLSVDCQRAIEAYLSNEKNLTF